jgi:hypothetical protein
MKNSNDTIRIQTRDILACASVPNELRHRAWFDLISHPQENLLTYKMEIPNPEYHPDWRNIRKAGVEIYSGPLCHWADFHEPHARSATFCQEFL